MPTLRIRSATGVPIPSNYPVIGEDAFEIRSDGRSYYSLEVRRLQQDEKLKYNLLNGHIYKVKNDAGVFVSVASSLVLIPKGTDASGW